MNLQHPTVLRERAAPTPPGPSTITADQLRTVLLESGADDASCIQLDSEHLDEERAHVLGAMPGARTLVAFCVRMNPEPLRSPARSLANNEFHHSGDEVNEVARRAAMALTELGIPALAPPMGFPMEMDEFPGRIWVVSHKRVAVAAGLGVMGLHRNVIHPRFGNFILLGTVIVGAEVEQEAQPLDFSPCLDCKLCVAACPVGAVAPDGRFDFSACYTHNYREFMGGFTDWVETVADAGSARAYRGRVSDSESASMWQSLSFGANYKAAYCMSVCPAGEELIGPFLHDRPEFLKQVVKPLQAKEESLYVVPGSDAEAHARRRFPHKPLRHVNNSLRPSTVEQFAQGLPLVFQREAAADLNAVFQFRFRGEDRSELTVVIREREVRIERGLVGEPDLLVDADARSWIEFVRGDLGVLRALLTRRVRVRGPLKLLVAFGRCFL